MRAVAATLLVVGFGLSASADDPRTLASRLAHPNYHDRETATKQLIAVGVPALPALEEVRRSGSPEAVRRATTVLFAIRSAEDSRQAVAAKSVSLNFQGKPLSVAVAELRHRTGVNLVLDPKAVADPTRTVSVKTGDLPPWQAVEAFRAAAGLCEVFQTDPQPANGLSTTYSSIDSRYPIRTLSTARPSDVAVVWRDGTDAVRPSDCSTGVRVLVVGNASHDRVSGEVTFLLDVTPTAGLNWQRTAEVRIGRVESAAGRRLEPVVRHEPVVVRFHSSGRPLLDAFDEVVPTRPDRPSSTRAFPVTLAAARAVTRLKVLEGVVCGDVHRASQPLLEIDDLPAAVGKTFDGPLGSTLTVVALNPGRVADTTDVVVRCTSFIPSILRMKGMANVGEIIDVAFTHTVGGRMKLYDGGGAELPRPTRVGTAATGDGTRETHTFTLTFPRTDSGAPKPAKLVVLGTKVVAVRVPFKLEHVELK